MVGTKLYKFQQYSTVGEQGATGHTWQTEEVPNMIIAIQVQVLKQCSQM
jgi:hypothetical protein